MFKRQETHRRSEEPRWKKKNPLLGKNHFKEKEIPTTKEINKKKKRQEERKKHKERDPV